MKAKMTKSEFNQRKIEFIDYLINSGRCESSLKTFNEAFVVYLLDRSRQDLIGSDNENEIRELNEIYFFISDILKDLSELDKLSDQLNRSDLTVSSSDDH